VCPPTTPFKSIKWRYHHVSVVELYIQDDISRDIGLTFPHIDGCPPFVCLPQKISLGIISYCGLLNIFNALQACGNLRQLLFHSKKKLVFTDCNKKVRYACVGLQVSWNSQKVHDHPSFMEKLPSHHWESLLCLLLRWTKECFKTIADHQVISHLHHKRNVVPFKNYPKLNPHQILWQNCI
jgi:hypothetical protein